MADRYRTVIGVVLLIAIAGGGFVLWQRETGESDLEFSSSTPDVEMTGSSGMLFVDVEGAVVNPGVYELAYGARVEDAISAAGGLTEDADLDRFGLSRAAKVSDEQLIRIPRQSDTAGGSASADSSSGCTNINLASSSELDELSGIGEARAASIMEARPYTSLEELVTKDAIPQSVFDSISSELCL